MINFIEIRSKDGSRVSIEANSVIGVEMYKTFDKTNPYCLDFWINTGYIHGVSFPSEKDCTETYEQTLYMLTRLKNGKKIKSKK